MPPSSTPRPGRAARGSATGRPVMTLLDLLGRRWTMRVIWELREGTPTFRELQDRCGGMSSSVLSQRLGELREAGVVTGRSTPAGRGIGPGQGRDTSGYALTGEGRRLLDAMEPLHAWAERWAKRDGR